MAFNRVAQRFLSSPSLQWCGRLARRPPTQWQMQAHRRFSQSRPQARVCARIHDMTAKGHYDDDTGTGSHTAFTHCGYPSLRKQKGPASPWPAAGSFVSSVAVGFTGIAYCYDVILCRAVLCRCPAFDMTTNICDLRRNLHPG